MNTNQRDKPKKAARVIIDPDIRHALFVRRADSGEPIQSQVNAILRKHFAELGVVEAGECRAAAG